MKIQGPNPFINKYRNQQQKQVVHNTKSKNDELKISAKAKKLHQNDSTSIERSKYVADIKKRIQSGEYKIDYDKTAQKMIDFWTKNV